MNFDVTIKLFDHDKSYSREEGLCQIPRYSQWSRPHLETTYIVYLLKDQQISWNSFKAETLCSHWYFTKHNIISVSDSALHNLWYCCMGPSCSNKPGNTTYLKETCSSFNSLCSIQISCDPATQLIQYNILSLNFQFCRHFALLCMTFVINLCRQTFPTYFFFQHKCIAVILGFQTLVVIFQDKSVKTLTF